jgi:hypothetical protein
MITSRPTAAAATLGLCLALGPAIAGFFIYKGILEAKRGDRYVTAKGLVERVEKADRGVWEVSFKVSGNNLAELYQKLSSGSEIISNFIKKEGFVEKEITIGSPRVVDLQTQGNGNTESLPKERYLIESDVSVNSSKVDSLNKLSAQTGELISQNITVTRSGARFYLDKFNSLRPQLIVEATKNAEEVATSFAKTTGSQLGGIRKANQGTISMTSLNASPNHEYDEGVDSLMKKIRVVSTIEFYLQ